MFHSSAKRLRAWFKRAEDILGDAPVDAPPHPHRRPLRWDRTRRAGSVQPRYAHCISPVRAPTPATIRATGSTARDTASR
jgi:hypothetical protein